jgi:hypothetical protein
LRLLFALASRKDLPAAKMAFSASKPLLMAASTPWA